MEPVIINTSQNVSINYEPAGLGNRLLASILDILFKIGTIITIGVAISLLSINTTLVRTANSTNILIILYILIFLPFLFYDFLFETFMHGQTPGKKLMKIKIVKLDGSQPTVGSYLLRWLIGLLEIGMSQGLIALISIAVSKNSQRLGDMAAGTTVIRIKPAVTLQDTILQHQKNENYKTTFTQVSLLNDADIQLIKDVLDFYKQTNHDEALNKLTKKMKDKTGIITSLQNEDFLTTLLNDYNYQQLDN